MISWKKSGVKEGLYTIRLKTTFRCRKNTNAACCTIISLETKIKLENIGIGYIIQYSKGVHR